MQARAQAEEDPETGSLGIRRARSEDVPLVTALDAKVTGLAKPDYWRDVFERYGERRLDERFFLIAEVADQDRRDPILGFIVGEVRAWEFGSQPCGWVFGFSVEPEARLKGVGTGLFDAIAAEFKHAGVDRMRTMVARNNHLHMTFFRSEGMMAGPYIQLEKDLD
jgi:GNAT superfamily N-acetyltransferase